MLATDLRSGIRQLKRGALHTAILLIGLSLAFATAWVTIGFAMTVIGVDLDVPDAARIFRLENLVDAPGAPQGWLERSPMPFKENWARSGAPVESSVRIYPVDLSIKIDSELRPQTVAFVDAEFSDVFGIEPVRGDIRKTLARPDGVVLSTRGARQLFGTEEVIGRTLLVAGQQHSVGAVISTRPRESALAYDMFVSLKSQAFREKWRLDAWYGLDAQNYIKLPPQVDGALVLERAKAMLEGSPFFRGLPPNYIRPGATLWTPRLVNLSDLQMKGAGSEKTFTLLLGLFCSTAILMVLAAVNFVNLMSVRISARQTEIGVRKSIGANPSAVTSLFVAEALILSSSAFLLCVPLAYLLSVGFESSTNVPVWSAMATWRSAAMILAVSSLFGLSSAAYPAWLAYRVRPATVITGRGGQDTASGIYARRFFTALGFIAAMSTLATSLVIYLQAAFAEQASVGFSSKGLWYIDAPVNFSDPRLEAFRSSVGTITGVSSAALSNDIPGRGKAFGPLVVRDEKGNSLSLNLVATSPDFFNTYGIDPIAGRAFQRGRDTQGATDIVVISALAVKELGYATPAEAVGRPISVGRAGVPAQIIGVVPDIQLRSLRERLQQTIYLIGRRDTPAITVRISNEPNVIAEIRKAWQRYFPDEYMRIERVDNLIARSYSQDRQLAKLIAVASLMALIISACGSYALAAYAVQRRRREIALRRLHGARGLHVLTVIAKEFAVLLAISTAIAVPVIVWSSKLYLEQYTQRTSEWPVAIAVAVGIIGLAVAIAFAIQVARALRDSPTEALATP